MTPTAAGQLLVILLAPLLKGQHVARAGPRGYRDPPFVRDFLEGREAVPNRGDVRRPTV